MRSARRFANSRMARTTPTTTTTVTTSRKASIPPPCHAVGSRARGGRRGRAATPRHHAHVAIGAAVERAERLLVGLAVVRGDGRFDRRELDHDRPGGLALLEGHLRHATYQ